MRRGDDGKTVLSQIPTQERWKGKNKLESNVFGLNCQIITVFVPKLHVGVEISVYIRLFVAAGSDLNHKNKNAVCVLRALISDQPSACIAAF